MDFYILLFPRDTQYIVFGALWHISFCVCFQFCVYIVIEKKCLNHTNKPLGILRKQTNKYIETELCKYCFQYTERLLHNDKPNF